MPKTNTCETCGIEFSRKNARRFCSKRCYGDSKITRTIKSCEVCGEPFSARANQVAAGFARFCSHRCANKLKKRSLEDRFWEQTDKRAPDECWPFTGARDADGYGVISLHSKQLRAPRVAYEIQVGPLENGKCVMHLCDNPSCVNGSHLRLGSQLENNQDKARKGRALGKGGYEWTPEIRARQGAAQKARWARDRAVK